jgi:hypothetical protein
MSEEGRKIAGWMHGKRRIKPDGLVVLTAPIFSNTGNTVGFLAFPKCRKLLTLSVNHPKCCA